MTKHWTKTFPQKGLIDVFQMRLLGYVGSAESGDPDAQRQLRGWEDYLNFDGVPADVMNQTALDMNRALSHVKGGDGGMAADALRDVLKLWGWRPRTDPRD